MHLLKYKVGELSQEDLLERDKQLYKFVKENYWDILKMIDMIDGNVYNIYETTNDKTDFQYSTICELFQN